MIHRYRRLETELRLGFPLRGAVRSVTIFLWISALALFSIPLSYSISIALFYAVVKINPNLEESITTARVLIAISILIILLVIVAGIVLLTKATRKMPEYIRLRRRKYYPLSIRDWIRSIVEKGMFTVMMIPHSEHRIVKFHASSLAIFLIGLLIAALSLGLITWIIYYPIKRASLRSSLSSIERRIEIEKENLTHLEIERDELQRIIAADKETMNSFYSTQIRFIKRFVLGNNFILGFVIGFFSSLAATYIYELLARIAAARRNRKTINRSNVPEA